MYNQQLKEMFIREYTTSESSYERYRLIFEKLEEFENKYGDFCTFNNEQVEESLAGSFGIRSNTRKNVWSFLNNYCAWCAKNNVDGALKSAKHSLDKDTLAYTYKMVSSAEDMQTFLDSIFDPEDECTVGNVYRCYFWLAYFGVKEEDAMCLKTSEVDDIDREIRVGNEIFDMYEESVKAFLFAKTLHEFRYIHPGYSKECWKPRFPGDSLLRGIKEPSLSTMRSTISAINKKAVLNGKASRRISYGSARLSGIFYRTYLREKELGVEPDFSTIVSDRMSGREYKLDTGRNTISALKRRFESEYKTDYENWKTAFNLE